MLKWLRVFQENGPWKINTEKYNRVPKLKKKKIARQKIKSLTMGKNWTDLLLLYIQFQKTELSVSSTKMFKERKLDPMTFISIQTVLQA